MHGVPDDRPRRVPLRQNQPSRWTRRLHHARCLRVVQPATWRSSSTSDPPSREHLPLPTLKASRRSAHDFSVAKFLSAALVTGRPFEDRSHLRRRLLRPSQALGRPRERLSDQYRSGRSSTELRCLTARPPQGVLPRPSRGGDLTSPSGRADHPARARTHSGEALAAPFPRTWHELVALRFATVEDAGRLTTGTPPRPIDPPRRFRFPSRPSTISARASRSRHGAVTPPANRRRGPAYDFNAHERTSQPRPDAAAAAAAQAFCGEPATSPKSTAVDKRLSVCACRSTLAALPSSIDSPILRYRSPV